MQSLKMNSFEEIKGIAVAIKNIKDSQNHIGIIYRNFEKNKIELLHLAFHRDLRNETPSLSLDCSKVTLKSFVT
jgi:hypothetical protein